MILNLESVIFPFMSFYLPRQGIRISKALQLFCLAWVLAFAAQVSQAQSTDIAWPSPVRSNDVQGVIPARDIGDARVTDHFYAFTGTPGDVLITVDGRNLNGDVDVFTFTGLRPLLKFSVYAGTSSPITKSIYLRQQEDLILRVEGRTPNDDDATYRIHFGGSFQPITSGPLAEHEDALEKPTVAESVKPGRRVSSAGARIEEPISEATPAPTPEVKTPEPEPKKPVVARNPRTRRPVTRRTKPAPPPKADETVANEGEQPKPPEETTETPKRTVKRPSPRTRTARKSTPPAKPAQSTTAEAVEPTGPRLIVETSDGTLVNRSMATVRRVIVENGQVVVVGTDGKIQRIPLASVIRMTIQ